MFFQTYYEHAFIEVYNFLIRQKTNPHLCIQGTLCTIENRKYIASTNHINFPAVMLYTSLYIGIDSFKLFSLKNKVKRYKDKILLYLYGLCTS
jgi:hypothetical protein